MSKITQLLTDIEAGDSLAVERLLTLVYAELRQLAAARIRERSDSLQATELVNEVYLRLAKSEGNPLPFKGRAHFFGAASEAMRRILVDHARSRLRLKRGGGKRPVPLEESIEATEEQRSEELLAIHEALDELELHDSQAARLVKLRYFVGLPHKDAAEAMEISRRVADRLWALARNWLYRKLKTANEE